MIITAASTPNEEYSKENEKVEIEQQQQQQQYDTTDEEFEELDYTVGGVVIGILFVLAWVYLSFALLSLSASSSKDKNKKERDLKRKQELLDRTNKLFNSMSYSTRNKISSVKH